MCTGQGNLTRTRATGSAVVRATSRKEIASGLGFDTVPRPSPVPELPLPWWRRMFGARNVPPPPPDRLLN